jgi:hypothetical protein
MEYWKPGTRALVPQIAGEGVGLSTAKRVQRILECCYEKEFSNLNIIITFNAKELFC